MVVRGRVKNGVVVLTEDVRLPEGEEVTVISSSPVGSNGHCILDIPPVSLGAVLQPSAANDDLLGEMLEGRS